MSAREIDQYLDALEEPKRTTLAQLRQAILDVLPEAHPGRRKLQAHRSAAGTGGDAR